MTELVDPTFEKIASFASREADDNLRIGPQTRLFEDLQLDGDDAFHFMDRFFGEFKVEPGDFDIDRYFGPEGFDPIRAVSDLLKRKGPRQVITLGMLQHAAEAGVWQTSSLAP